MTPYLTGTRDGNAKEERKKGENTNTTHLAQNGRTLEGQGKRKNGRTAGQKPTRGGGGRTEAPDTTYKARAKPTLAREGPQPDLTREHA